MDTTVAHAGQRPRSRVMEVPRARWTLSPDFVVRVAGLPLDALDALTCPSTTSWAEEMLDAEQRLRCFASRLSEALATAVGGLDDQASRRGLLRLRRAVHNLRDPGTPAAAIALTARHAPASEPDLRAWLAAHEHLEELRSAGPALLDRELAGSRRELRRLLAGPRMRNGLLLASPALAAQLDHYLDGRALSAKKARKIERSAVSYVYRTASKPSPFSTFTGVAVGRFAEPGPPVQTVPSGWASRVRISVVALSRLHDAVLADPGRRADLPVVPASGWGRDAERVRYVRRSLRTGDTGTTMTLDTARDQLFFLRRSEILEEMLAFVSREPLPLWDQVAAWLADRLGATPEECDHYLAALLDLGLLQVPVLVTGVHTADPVRAFRSSLLALDRPWATGLAHALDTTISCLDAYPEADAEGRRLLLDLLRRSLAAAMESLGSPGSAIPDTMLYEDVSVCGEPLVCDSAPWRASVEEPLRALERILPAFDQSLRHRQTLHAFFLARFGRGGRCDDLLSLVHDFHEDIYDEYQAYLARTPRLDGDGRLAGDPNWLASGTLEAMDSARAVFADRLARLVAAGPGNGEVEVDSDILDAVAEALGEAGSGFAATTHFLQRAGDLVVHNSAYGGFGFPFSRFTHWFDAAVTDRLRERAGTLAPLGSVLAEVTGGFATSNLNLHTRLTDHEIVCPGEVSSAPDEARIPLADLVLEHDDSTDRLVLRSRTLGREVVPVYLGYLVPSALPAISRTLLLLSPSATLWLDPWAGVPAPDSTHGVELRPRLRLGPLVLSRRSWTVSARDLLSRLGSAGGAEEFLAWQRWRRAHDVPSQVFATVRPPRGAPPTGPRPKPRLVDFGSALSLASFRAVLDAPDARVQLTEMLPGPGQLHVRSPEGWHAAELAVETVSDRTPAAPSTRTVRIPRGA